MDSIRKIVRSILISEGIINEAEKKMILYHGSPHLFENFKNTTTFFSETEKFALDYADQKSFDYAMDAEPKLYKVEVLTDLFDINDPKEYKQLASRLPEKVEYMYNNFGFTTEVDKNEILQNLRGLDTIMPYEPAINAKIGDKIDNPEYTKEKYIVVKRDEEYVYGFSEESYIRMTNNLTTSPINLRGSNPPEFKIISKTLQSSIKDIYSKDIGEGYVSENDIKAAVHDSFSSSEYKMTSLSSDALLKIKNLYNQAIQDVKKILPNMQYLKKFPIKEKVVELKDTWRFYENKHVSGLIKELGYGGYVAKENGVNTYAIFNPASDVKILEYQIPYGVKFSSWEDFKKFREFDKYIGKKLPEKTHLNNRWDLYKFYKSGISAEEAFRELMGNKEKYLYTYSY